MKNQINIFTNNVDRSFTDFILTTFQQLGKEWNKRRLLTMVVNRLRKLESRKFNKFIINFVRRWRFFVI